MDNHLVVKSSLAALIKVLEKETIISNKFKSKLLSSEKFKFYSVIKSGNSTGYKDNYLYSVEGTFKAIDEKVYIEYNIVLNKLLKLPFLIIPLIATFILAYTGSKGYIVEGSIVFTILMVISISGTLIPDMIIKDRGKEQFTKFIQKLEI